MVNKVYVVEDKKAGFNSPLSQYENDALAIRDFANACKTPGSLLNKNPEDFYLWEIGTYDTKKNEFTALPTPVVVAKANSYVEVKEM